ncbi:MAG: Uma2 family endonuclease [Candidatus Contendobacter sp.]|nr:Uma2 family endonuclease [Candidatus Contendobacter sp.]
MRLPERADGASCVSRDDYLEGAPELIVEVASTGASHDLHDQRKVYRQRGAGISGMAGAGKAAALAGFGG